MNETAALGTSILMPVLLRTRDAETLRLLARALLSVEEQEYPGPHEILLVDDGSPLPVERIVREIVPSAVSDSIRFVRCERNGRLVHALNIGLAEARHPFVARMDSDDLWRPGKIAAQFRRFAEDPDLSIVGTCMNFVDAAGRVTGTLDLPRTWPEILRYVVDVGCPFAHGSILARRDVFRLFGGYPHDPRTFHCEDFALWTRWLRFFRAAVVPEALYDYTVSDQSVSAQNRLQQKWATDRLRARFRELEPLERIPEAIEAMARASGSSVLEAGRLAAEVWQNGGSHRVASSAVPALRFLLRDRVVSTSQEAAGGEATVVVR